MAEEDNRPEQEEFASNTIEKGILSGDIDVPPVPDQADRDLALEMQRTTEEQVKILFPEIADDEIRGKIEEGKRWAAQVLENK